MHVSGDFRRSRFQKFPVEHALDPLADLHLGVGAGTSEQQLGRRDRRLEEDTCTDYDIIMTSEFELKGHFSQIYAPNHCCILWQVMKS